MWRVGRGGAGPLGVGGSGTSLPGPNLGVQRVRGAMLGPRAQSQHSGGLIQPLHGPCTTDLAHRAKRLSITGVVDHSKLLWNTIDVYNLQKQNSTQKERLNILPFTTHYCLFCLLTLTLLPYSTLQSYCSNRCMPKAGNRLPGYQQNKQTYHASKYWSTGAGINWITRESDFGSSL